jgi:excinuclease ABC subunit A
MERRYKETESSSTKIAMKFISNRSCATCEVTRLRRREARHAVLTKTRRCRPFGRHMSIGHAMDFFFNNLKLSGQRENRRKSVAKRSGSAEVPGERGSEY